MLRVAFDVDGVLADFQKGFRELASRITKRAIPEETDAEQFSQGLTAHEISRVWSEIARTPQWWVGLQPYEPFEIDRLYRLGREQRWEICFITTRPPSAGDTTQFQTQWWLESQGFRLPAVITVPGSRGELANALRLDAIVDDRLMNCMDVTVASKAKALYMLRHPDQPGREQALQRGIAVVTTLREAIDVLEGLAAALKAGRGPLAKLADWFRPKSRDARLPLDPREHFPMRKPE